MNKHLYRIVFNHALGLFQVVSELVRRPGRGASQADGVKAATVRPVSLGLWAAFGWIAFASIATAGQITPDANAPGNQRPTVLSSPNNAPLVNIQTPSAAGVSRNTYSQFDVGNEGAVLNNSRTNTQSQLAGSISGNPWLATGTAKVILNEVTGTHPSQLNGYVEVAGDRAQVVIANPAGIACDGCGFINANRVTLTTGVPVLNGGSLDGYRVTGGVIQVNGKGLDASRADYADIIARAVQVNGGIWAPQLQVTTGANQVNAAHTQVDAMAGTGDKPTVALDVSALGGMYANKIVLLGTEHGLGVRNAGTIGASAGDLVVTADGRLENTGSLQSQANAQISATAGVSNTGTISAARELAITTPQDVDNRNGTLNAARIAVDAGSLRNAGGAIEQTGVQAMTLDVGALSNRNGGRIGMPIVDAGSGGDGSSGTPGTTPAGTGGSGDGSGASAGNGATPGAPSVTPLADGLVRVAGLLDNDGGRITAASGFDLSATSGLNNDDGDLSVRQLTLSGGDLSNRGGSLSIDRASTVHASQVVNDGGQLSAAKALTFSAQALSNRSGSFLLADASPAAIDVAGAFDNTDGTFASNAAQLQITSGGLINDHGVVNHAGTGGFTLQTGDWQGAGGSIITASAATINAATVDHRGATLSAAQLALNAASFDNRGGTVVSSGESGNKLDVTGALDNGAGGIIQTNGDLRIAADSVGNAGGAVQQLGGGELAIQARELHGAGGSLASKGSLHLSGGVIDLAGGTTYASEIAMDANSLITSGGSLTASGTDALRINASQGLDNSRGNIATNGALQVTAGSLDNTGGTLSAAGAAPTSIQVSGSFTNNAGTLAAMGATSIHADTLLNQAGIIQAASGAALAVNVANLLDNSAKGTLASDGDLSITAATFDNSQGNVAHAGTGELAVHADALNGSGGTLASNGSLVLRGDAIDLRGGTTYAQQIAVDAASLATAGGQLTALGGTPLQLSVAGLLDNTRGTIATNGSLQLDAQWLTNTGGTLTAAGTDATHVAVAHAFENTGGTLAAMGTTSVAAEDVINAGGTLQAAGGSSLSVTASRLLDNSRQGVLAADGDLAVQASTLDNRLGAIKHAGQGALTLLADALDGAGGTIASNGALTVDGGAIDLRGGTTYAQSVALHADSLTTAGGSLAALGGTPLQLAVRGLFDNTHGTVASNGALQVTAQTLANAGGALTAAGVDRTDVSVTGTLDNTGGSLASMGATTVQAGDVVNKGGTLQAGGGSTLTVTAVGLLDNGEHGLLASDGDLAVAASTLDNTQGTIQHGGQGALAIRAATLSGQGGTIAGNGTLAITGNAIDLRNGVTAAQKVAIDAGSLTTAGGKLSSSGSDVLHISARDAVDNTGGHIATNGTLQFTAGSFTNANGSVTAAGAGDSSLTMAQAFANTGGVLATAGGLSVHAGSIDNTRGTLQSASTDDLSLIADGQLANDSGLVAGNGALVLKAGGASNRAGTIQVQQDIDAQVAGALDNSGGALVAGGDVTLAALTLLNRDTGQAGSTTSPRGIYGHRIQVLADTIDNTRGQLQASDALTLGGRSQAATALTNAGGVLDGSGQVAITASSLDNTAGRVVQRGDTGALSLVVSGALGNTAHGLIGAEGTANLRAGSIDNSGGTVFAQHDLTLLSYGNLFNRSGGQLQTHGALNLAASGGFDNSGGALDATGSATVSAASIANVGGSLLAGDAGNSNASLQVTTVGTIDNRGGSLGDRGGDVTLRAASIDNSSGGSMVAGRNLNLDGVGALGNGSGTVYATGALSFQNGGATLDNTSGQLGAGGAAWLTLASIANASGGHIQSDTLWLNTAVLNLAGGEVDANALHAQLSAIYGVGRLYGAQWLDAHISGDYTHVAGQRFESDGKLSLAVDGTLTNQGTLQTQGELDLTAANLINQGTINASAANGSGAAHVTIGGSIDNQHGASLEGDTLDVSASDITNTGNIVGDTIRIDANTLTNGRDLGTALAAVDYGEGFIGASNSVDLRIAQRLDNLDGDIYSGGNLAIAGRADGTHVAALNNVSGRIQGQGNVTINADQIDNRRRVINTATIMLSAPDQAANSTSSTQAQYAYTDTNPNHQPPAIDPSQVVDATEFAKAKAYCDSHNYSSLRCIGYPQGSGAPAVFQSQTTSTLTQVTVITSASADSRIESGGDMVLNGSIRNTASTIASTRNLTINGSGGSDGWASVQNVAWMPTGVIQTMTNYQTQSQYLINSPRTWLDGDWWTYDTSSASQSAVLSPGNVPGWISYNIGQGLAAVITAGGSLSIGGDVTNTSVGAAGGSGAIHTGNLMGPGNTALGGANIVHAGGAAAVDRAQGSAAGGAGNVGEAQGQSVGQAAGVGQASGSKVASAGATAGAGSQTLGSSDQPLPGYVPPSNAIYAKNGDPGAPFLVNTAPRFTKGASTSSDYLLKALGDDPSNMQKRLGDGYYEQQLVLDQLLQLTGRRTLNGGDPMAQYTALMDGAASEAAHLGLSLGEPLTSSQIASLQSDIVWLVDQVVDGQHVLVPVVYLSKATADKLKSGGALIAGNTVNIQSSGTVSNDGTISGTQGTTIVADTLINHGLLSGGQQLAIATQSDTINTGTLSGGVVAVQAGRDLLNSGAITSTGDMALQAGRDLTVGAAPVQSGGNLVMVAGHDLTATASHISAVGNAQLVAGHDVDLAATVHTTRTGGASNGQETTAHAVTSITAGGSLAIAAGNDLTSQGAQLSAGNQLGLAAGHDMTLNAVTDTQANYSKTAAGHTVTTARSDDDTVRGTTLSGTNGVSATAGHDLTATAATIRSDNGGIGLSAGHDLTLNTAQENHTTTTDTKTTSSSLLSSSTKRTHDSVSDSYAIGTTVSGDSVTMAAGNNLTATAAQIVADHDIVMAAGNNLTLNTANDVHTEEHGTSKTKSGLMGAGVGVMVGEAKQSQSTTITQTTPTGTTVGSLGGSVTVSAGNNVHLTDANVLSDTGTAIVGKNVTIDAALGTTDVTQTQKQSSSGLTLSLGGAAVTAIQGVYYAAKGASKSDDSRLAALYAAQGAQTLFSPGAGHLMGLTDGHTGADAISQAAHGNTSGINLQLGIGASSASSKTVTHDEAAYGSTIHSNGNVVIAATGGDLNVIGSQISGNNVALAAANNINLLSQAEQHTDKSTNKNASGGVGVQIGTDGFGVYAQASVGKGDAHGNGTTHADTTINATDNLTLISGGDTTIQGAQAKGNTVLADIGGNLHIASEQDTDDYTSKQQQASGKVVVGYGGSASGSYNQSNIDNHYASVTQVSGIAAGDGGFNIHVNGNTDLKGGVIASTADASKNVLDTGSLTFSNIENKASYSASSVGISGGYGSGSGGISPSIGVPQHDSQSSTTQAGIAQGTIITRDGGTDLAGLDRNPDINASGLTSNFDQKKIQDNMLAGQLAGQVGMTAVGDLSSYMANHATTEAEQKSWQDGGSNKVLLHGLVGAATAALGNGNVAGGALGAGASEAASGAMQDYLRQQGIDPYSQEGKSLMQLGSAAIGAVGGGSGAATALQGEQYNRQLHQSEIDWIKSHAKDFASQQCGCDPSAEQIDAATQQLAQQAARQTDMLWAAALPGDDSAARQYLAGAQGTFTNTLGNAQKLFSAEGNQFLQPLMYLPDANANRGFYQGYVQTSTGSVNTGLEFMLAQAGFNAYMNPGEAVWNAASGAVIGIGNAVLHPIDTFNGAGQDLGTNAAYAFNPGMVNSQLQAVYGQDVTTAAATLSTLNTSLTLIGATGAGKGAAAAIEGAAKSAAVDALTAAVKAGWKGDAAGLEQFTRAVVDNTGSVNRFLSADAVNAAMDTYNWSPAWQSGTMVADATLKPGTVVNMVVDKTTYEALTKPGADISRAFGGWATFDDVSGQAYARNQLAITSQMKPDASYVIQVEITKPLNAQIGIVGEQPGAAGGGNQLHFNLPPEQRADTFKFVGGRELH